MDQELNERYTDKDRDGVPDRIDNSYSPPEYEVEKRMVEFDGELEPEIIYRSKQIAGLEISISPQDGGGSAKLNGKWIANVDFMTQEAKFDGGSWRHYDFGVRYDDYVSKFISLVENHLPKRYASVSPAFCDYLQRQDFSFSKCKKDGDNIVIAYPATKRTGFEQLQTTYQAALKKGGR